VTRWIAALMLVALAATTLAGGAAAQNNGQTNHGSGRDRQGYCEVPPGSGNYEPCAPGTNGTEPEQSQGNFLYGEPGVDRRAYPETGGGPGCTAQSALNSNPSQAAGDNVGYPSENAAAQAQGGPFSRDCS
jgi:hypothetical protein